jgi:hypothetical protein
VGSGETLQKASGKVRTSNNTGACCHSHSVQSIAVIICCSKTSFSPLLILGIFFPPFHSPQSKLTKQTNPTKDYNAFIADFHGAGMFRHTDKILMERSCDYCVIGRRHLVEATRNRIYKKNMDYITTVLFVRFLLHLSL